MHLASSLSLCQFWNRFQKCKLTVLCCFFFLQWSIHEIILKRKLLKSYSSLFKAVLNGYLLWPFSHHIWRPRQFLFGQSEAFTTRKKASLTHLIVFPQCIFTGELWGPYYTFNEQPLWCKVSLFWYSNYHESNVAVSHGHGHYHLNQPEWKKGYFLPHALWKTQIYEITFGSPVTNDNKNLFPLGI